MKKLTLILILISALLLSACGAEAEKAQELPEESWEQKLIVKTRLPNAEAVFTELRAGQELILDGEAGNFYRLQLEGQQILAEKRFIRPESQPEPEQIKLWSYGDCLLYKDLYLESEPSEPLPLNTELKLICPLGSCALVEYQGKEAYAESRCLHYTPFSYPEAQPGEEPSEGGEPEYGGQDGGDIQLRYKAPDGGFVQLSAAEVKELPDQKAYVLADKAEALLALLPAGFELELLEQGEDWCRVLIGETEARIRSFMLELPGDKEFTPYSAYAGEAAEFYLNYRQSDTPEKLPINTELKLIYELPRSFAAEYQGKIGYVPKSCLMAGPMSYEQYVSENPDSGWTEPVL